MNLPVPKFGTRFLQRHDVFHHWDNPILLSTFCGRRSMKSAEICIATIEEHVESMHLSSEECPTGFQDIDDFCFMMGSGKKTFKKATEACQQIGGFLAEPRSEEITTALKSLTFTGTHLWIGLHDIDENRTFGWQTDSEPLPYTNWATNQPDNENGNQHCVTILNIMNGMN